MPTPDEDFLKKLLETFRIEADEHIAAMSVGLTELEKTAGGGRWIEIAETIQREAHSLKGAARTVNRGEIESACHSLESVLAGLKREHSTATPALFGLMHQVLDALAALTAPAAPDTRRPPVAALVRRLDDAATRAPLAPEAFSASPSANVATSLDASMTNPASATIRVPLTKLDSVMRQTEELLAHRLAASQRVDELREALSVLGAWKRHRAKARLSRSFAPTLVRAAGDETGARRRSAGSNGLNEYVEAERELLNTLEGQLTKLKESAEHDFRALSATVGSLLDSMKQLHMLPFSTLLQLFPRVARSLAKDQGKEVDLVVRGGEIELDRRILDEMKDPFTHLLRNSIDHGMEKPEMRQQKGKPGRGKLSIAISHTDTNEVEVLIQDDGTGIDVEKVKAVATGLGVVSPEEIDHLDERALLTLTFLSGISTSPIINELSGRGLGLAIVREKVDALGGTIAVESRRDAGTTVRITLPLTIATFRGVLVRTGDQLFIVPAVSVDRVARVASTEIQTVGNHETIPLAGETVSLIWLSDVLELPRAPSESGGNVRVVVLVRGLDRVAFGVDAVLGEQEVQVKGLGRQLARVRNVRGASVLGTGRVVPVLNVHDLMKSATKQAGAPVAAPAIVAAARPKRSILVVDDSITARTLLKNILEAAGYRVTTAVDGIEAFATVKAGAFDLIVSDVEMPRMDGFDLTAKIRADKHLSELPVVLVTALESREHRERGIDAGANAYIAKSSFEHSNLLEVIGQLV